MAGQRSKGSGQKSFPAKKARAHNSRLVERPGKFRHDEPVSQSLSSTVPQFRRPSGELRVIFGFHAVRAALAAKKRKLFDLYATKAAADKLQMEATAAGLAPHIVEAEDLTRRLGANCVHQGVMLEAGALEPLDISEIQQNSGMVLLLDQITDPHNVGAILRTAAAFAVDALIITERHAPEITGVLAKAASGGLEYVSIVTVTNLARALEELGKLGYLRIGLDSQAEENLTKLPLTRPLALVLGGEGKGLRRLSREKCDFLARLDMPGPIKSLNVSNACAVALTQIQNR
jgi:23S rRNA (guanosine2251-2'-O)-methyltransferase